MKIPTKLNILGKRFDVVLGDSQDNTSDELGVARLALQKIWIDNNKHVHMQVQEETLLHEIIEMINQMGELELSHQTMTILTTALYQVLSENRLSFGDE